MFLEFVREENNFCSRGNKKFLAKKFHAFSISAGENTEKSVELFYSSVSKLTAPLI
jgi:hypothetical protein